MKILDIITKSTARGKWNEARSIAEAVEVQKKHYGYWYRNGKLYPVPWQEHKGALEIWGLREYFDAYRQGMVRLVTGDSSLGIEGMPDGISTFLTDARRSLKQFSSLHIDVMNEEGFLDAYIPVGSRLDPKIQSLIIRHIIKQDYDKAKEISNAKLVENDSEMNIRRIAGDKAYTDAGVEIDLKKANVWQDEDGNFHFDPNTPRDPNDKLDPQTLRQLRTQIKPGSKVRMGQASKKPTTGYSTGSQGVQGAVSRGGAVTRGSM